MKYAKDYIKERGILNCLQVEKDDYENWVGSISQITNQSEEELYIMCQVLEQQRSESFQDLKGIFFKHLISFFRRY